MGEDKGGNEERGRFGVEERGEIYGVPGVQEVRNIVDQVVARGQAGNIEIFFVNTIL